MKMISGRMILRPSLLALLALSLGAPVMMLRAQEQASPTSKQQSSQENSNQPPANPNSANQSSAHQTPANQGSSNGPGFAQQLTRETREAAGEDKAEHDDKAGFKMSGSVTYIAKKLGVSTETASFLSFLFNFLVVAGIVIWASRKYLPGAFKARTAAIQKAMQEAQKASEEARRKLAEIESRLKKVDVEIGMMRDAAEKDAGQEEARIEAATQEDARKMVESAHQEIDAAAKAARRALTAYAADLAVALAQNQIRVDADTDQSLVRNFASDLGAFSNPRDASGKDRN